MDLTNISSAPDLLNELADIVAFLTVKDVQNDASLYATCQRIRVACQALFTNVGGLLLLDNSDGLGESTDSDANKVCQ